MKSTATDTHEITEATACRCLALSERTSASLSWILGVDPAHDALRGPVDEARGEQAADQQQGDVQPGGQDPHADLAVPEIVPALGEGEGAVQHRISRRHLFCCAI